jgi:endonuclease/exonuclease/phosphatase family metal-dependent hydrolase
MTSVRAIAAAAVAVLATFTLAGDTRPTRYHQSYLQFNLCGNACNRGALTVVDEVVIAIGRGRPLVVTLNEVCENQYDRLRIDLPGYAGLFDPTGAMCRNGARYGNAILARTGEMRPLGTWELPNPAGDEPRRLVCARTLVDAAPVIVCVTHISNELGNIAPQVSTVANILSGLDRDEPMLVGGDFNTNPFDTRLDPMYAAFVEVDSTADPSVPTRRSATDIADGPDILNAATYGPHKYDYIFLSVGDWSVTRADAVPAANGFTDHDALWAMAALRLG